MLRVYTLRFKKRDIQDEISLRREWTARSKLVSSNITKQSEDL